MRGSSWCVVAVVLVALAASAALPAAGLPPLAPKARAKVEALLAKMTLDEKIGQMTLLTSDWEVTGPSVRKDYEAGIQAGRVGAIFNAYTVAFTRRLQRLAVEKTRLHVPLMFGYDVIHGFRTIFPLPLAEAASWDLERVERAARVAAVEASAEGLQWTFAPMVDVARDPRWGRVAEGSGEDVWLGCRMAEARVRGFQGTDLAAKDTVMACAKHFAAYGAAQAGRDYHTVDVSEHSLLETYLPPFQAAVDAGVGSFMTAFDDLNGVPCTGNAWLLTEVLRRRWGFSGFVVTDYTSINEMVNHGYARDVEHAAELSALAGVDQDMQGSAYSAHLADLVRRSAVPESRVDEAARRVLEAKARLGLLDDPYRYFDERRERRVPLCAEHVAAARDLARRSQVLLRNEGGLLPLAATGAPLAVVGPLADDARAMLGCWSGAGKPEPVVTPLAAFRERLGLGKVLYAKGCEVTGTGREGFAEALAVARRARAVVAVLGEGADMSGEAASRADLGLPGVQGDLLRELLGTGTPVVLVVASGRPLCLTWEATHVPAILQAWHLGTTAGHALVDVLLGDFAPSGRLPVTFPRCVGQIPIHYDVKNTGRPASPSAPEQKYVSRYLDQPNEPLFPFGYGLTYTRFVYRDLRLSATTLAPGGRLVVSAEVANVGARDGEEVAQLYVRDLVGSVTRPVRQLKGFHKVLVPAGQSRRVSFELTPADLAFWRADGSFGSEPGRFHVFVAPDAASGLQGEFELAGPTR